MRFEGNLVAVKMMVDDAADLSAQDRWDNTAYDEAKKASAGKLVEYLESLTDEQKRPNRGSANEETNIRRVGLAMGSFGEE